MDQRTCKICHHECHCGGREHADEYAELCKCENCDCGKKETSSTVGGVVIDDTGECESCQ